MLLPECSFEQHNLEHILTFASQYDHFSIHLRDENCSRLLESKKNEAN